MRGLAQQVLHTPQRQIASWSRTLASLDSHTRGFYTRALSLLALTLASGLSPSVLCFPVFPVALWLTWGRF